MGRVILIARTNLAKIGGNTVGYFVIGIASRKADFNLGRLIGVQTYIRMRVFPFRVAENVVEDEIGILAAVRSAVQSWTLNPHFTILQITTVGIGSIALLLFLVAIFLLVPGAIVLFDLATRRELSGSDPRTILPQYKTSVCPPNELTSPR